MSRAVMARRVRSSLVWVASAGDQPLGELRAFIRPDERCFVSLRGCADEANGPLVAAVGEDLDVDLFTTIEEVDEQILGLRSSCGFRIHRRESVYSIPTDPRLNGLNSARLPTDLTSASAADVDEARLRTLDDLLRQDVPGTDGWRWQEADFREETFARDGFDPATYRIAVERAFGDYVGLARVWMDRARPRLGLIAVLPKYRRRGVARALLAEVFTVLHERGYAEVSTEVDDANIASTELMWSLGARRIGGHLELRRPAPSSGGGR